MSSSSKSSSNPVIVWFRRDLRLGDNLALDAARQNDRPVVCVYIREKGSDFAGANGAAQAWWLHHSLAALADALERTGNRLILRSGDPKSVLTALCEETGADTIHWNRRYDPNHVEPDADLKAALEKDGYAVNSFAGFLMHEPTKLLTKEGKRYHVYTPFWRAFIDGFVPLDPRPHPRKLTALDKKVKSERIDEWALLPSKPDWASRFSELWTPGEDGAHKRLKLFLEDHLEGYKKNRDHPAGQTTSLLSPHLAFGEISPHTIWRALDDLDDDAPEEDVIHFRKEIVWREFSWHLLFHHPDLDEVNLNRRYDKFPWQKSKSHFQAWTEGKTGYPIVDAGMRQLWQHGWMHNRVRMIVASFLIKDLLIDWRDGEKWFRDTLVDCDRASNAASWQWVAGSGADAAPYFRIFNPVRQGESFDPDGAYVREFCPELKDLPNKYIHEPHKAPSQILEKANITLGKHYPQPIVAHDKARKFALQSYEEIRGE